MKLPSTTSFLLPFLSSSKRSFLLAACHNNICRAGSTTTTMSADKAGGYTYRWPRPSVTVDTLIFTIDKPHVSLLLIKRGNDPFKGSWALPGGFVDENEGLDEAAKRELIEETNLTNITFAQVGAYGNPGRDPRGHTITVAYAAFVPNKEGGVKAGDDAADASWHSFGQLPPLAFDHKDIIEETWKRMVVLPDPEGGAGYVVIERGSGKVLCKIGESDVAEAISTASPFK